MIVIIVMTMVMMMMMMMMMMTMMIKYGDDGKYMTICNGGYELFI